MIEDTVQVEEQTELIPPEWCFNCTSADCTMAVASLAHTCPMHPDHRLYKAKRAEYNKKSRERKLAKDPDYFKRASRAHKDKLKSDEARING